MSSLLPYLAWQIYPILTYSACGIFNKPWERIEKLKERIYLKYLFRNKLEKAYFAHDAAYSYGKDLAKGTISEKILKDKAYKLLEIVNMMDIKDHDLLWSISFLIRNLDQ